MFTRRTGVVTLQRRLMEGRSVSKINGETVQMATLKAVSAILIDIHGQHEHQSLLYKKNHLAIVDAFAGEETKQAERKSGGNMAADLKEK